MKKPNICPVCLKECPITKKANNNGYYYRRTCSPEHKAEIIKKNFSKCHGNIEVIEKRLKTLRDRLDKEPELKEKLKKISRINVAKATEAAARIPRSFERKEFISTVLFEKSKTSLIAAAGPSHFMAKTYSFFDPNNNFHTCTNLMHFIRTHEELFDKSDVEWKPVRSSRYQNKSSKLIGNLTCRAYKGLVKIGHGDNKSWKKWRLANG